MTAELGASDRARIGRSGLTALSAETGLALFDAATRRADAHVIAVPLDLAALRGQQVPPLLRSLIRPTRRAVATVAAVEPGTEVDLLALVRTTTAVVLGYSGSEQVDPQVSFSEIGFDSLTAVELRNRLSRATGLRLKSTLVFDFPTPTALAAHLTGQLAPDAPPPASVGTDLVSALCRTAFTGGEADRALDLLRVVAANRPTVVGAEGVSSFARLAAHGPGLRVVCVSPLTPLTGPDAYARFAEQLQGAHPVEVLGTPGFGDADPLVGSLEQLLDGHASNLLDRVGDAPFVLAGHSSGGLLAHQIARVLAERGRAPEALVLMDTYQPGQHLRGEFIGNLMRELYERAGGLRAITSAGLSAMVHYGDQNSGWTMSELPLPVLAVHAAAALADGVAPVSAPETPYSRTVVADGDHFSMLEGTNAAEVGLLVRRWLSGLPGGVVDR